MASATGDLRRAAIIGFPLGHSLSPVIHALWASREGVAATYDKIETAPGYESFADAAGRLAAKGYRGVNVTIPHKENALRFALEKGGVSERARAAGAANMLTFRPDGPYADNSDVIGFAAALSEVLTSADKRGKAVVLGAGGGARGVVLALKELGYQGIVVANRTKARAQALAADLAVGVADWDRRHRSLAGADVLVNATSLGMMGGSRLDVALDGLAPTAIVADIVYAKPETALLVAAKARGLRAFDGLSMLMHQAVPAYKAWLGREAVVDAALRAALERAIAERSRP